MIPLPRPFDSENRGSRMNTERVICLIKYLIETRKARREDITVLINGEIINGHANLDGVDFGEHVILTEGKYVNDT
jgi:hypothetical protein